MNVSASLIIFNRHATECEKSFGFDRCKARQRDMMKAGVVILHRRATRKDEPCIVTGSKCLVDQESKAGDRLSAFNVDVAVNVVEYEECPPISQRSEE